MLHRYACLSLLALLSFACTDSLEDLTEIEETRYSAEFALPIVDSRVSLTDIVGEIGEDFAVTVDPDGLLRFRYSGEVPAVGPDIVFDRLEQIAQGVVIPLTRNRQGAPFAGVGDVDVDTVRISGGTALYNLPNVYDEPVSVTLSLPEARLNGVPFSVTGDLPAYSGSGEPPTLANPDAPIQMAGYALAVPEDSLYIEYSIRDMDGNELPVPERTILALENLTFSFVSGYLGTELYQGIRDTVEVDFFDDYLEGDIFFVDPTVTLTLTSSFGLPALAQVEVLQVVDVEGNVIPITGPAITNGFDFDFPRIPGNQRQTVFTFNSQNSNIDEVLSARPVALDYLVNAEINPDGDVGITGFLTDSSFYTAQVDVELPLFGNASDFTLRDTFDLDIMDDFDNVEDITFRLTTYNEIPIDIRLRGTFVDADGNAVADLTNGESFILRAPDVDGNGDPVSEVRNSEDFAFDGAAKDAILGADRLIVEFDISTTNGGGPFVRITDDQDLRLLLGAKVGVRN